jgi:hypothetical protein
MKILAFKVIFFILNFQFCNGMANTNQLLTIDWSLLIRYKLYAILSNQENIQFLRVQINAPDKASAYTSLNRTLMGDYPNSVATILEDGYIPEQIRKNKTSCQ